MNVRAWTEERREELIQDIADLVAIPSVSSPGEDGSPFGTGCVRVLQEVLCKARHYGLCTENCEDYCGTAWIPGESEQEIGVFSHLDVVPEGDGWMKTEPYRPIVIDGWLYGRGSADNKGACVAALYALRYIKESGISLKHTVRQYYGCDEERGMEDIEYYLTHHRAPEFSLVPDAAFPVCYGEKGRYKLECGTVISEDIISLTGGEGENSVPGCATVLLRGVRASLPESEQICITTTKGNTCIKAYGLAAHAAKPESGYSAIARLTGYLLSADCLNDEDREKIEFLNRLCSDSYGKTFDIACDDADSGALTMIGSLLSYEDGRVKLCVDIRYPATEDSAWIIEKLESKFNVSCWDLMERKHSQSFCRDREDAVILSLTEISNRIQGRKLAPYCMSGGTYARKLPNAVGYGPGVAGQKKPCIEGHGYGHQPDECVCIDYLVDAVEIYVEAILALDEMLNI